MKTFQPFAFHRCFQTVLLTPDHIMYTCTAPPLFLWCLWITHAAAVVTAAQTWSNWRCQPAHKDTWQRQNRAHELTAAGFRLLMQGLDRSDSFNPRARFNPNYILKVNWQNMTLLWQNWAAGYYHHCHCLQSVQKRDRRHKYLMKVKLWYNQK